MELGLMWLPDRRQEHVNLSKISSPEAKSNARRCNFMPGADPDNAGLQRNCTGITKKLLVRLGYSIHISFLNPAWEPSDVRHHLYSCGYERDEDALEVETQWVRNKTSPFSSLLMPR